MRRHLFFASVLSLVALLNPLAPASALTVQELAERFRALPTVAEADLPPLPNQPEPFSGVVKHIGFTAHTWVRFPFVENPGSFGFDRHGRLHVAEANRFWLGVPDLRGANELVRGDFQSITVADRQKLYDSSQGQFPEGWFTAVADRIIRLEDRDGNGAADHRTVFSDHFKGPLDGIGFSVLAEDEAVYFTCIPNLWKLTDQDGDGVADTHEPLVEGFGVRVSFIGHDLHGITRGPDGRLYFSVGDRGYHVTTPDGRVHAASGRGAIFRCESDGSGFEVFCTGLRNPQELAFDEHGNLFTFDNTGDIGDAARMVYALEGSDSGWDMAHQSPHQYRTILDWGALHPPKSMWVEEKMFATHTEEQPQWVYPPAAHVGRGPSGVTWLTGESLPPDLRGKFLLADYRGASENCVILAIGINPRGAGYTAVSEDVLAQGTGASDVELGYDGNIYLCDFGGGWSVNQNGAIHVLQPADASLRSAGAAIATQFKQDWKDLDIPGLIDLIGCPDRRLRQFAQFELANRRESGSTALAALSLDSSKPVTTRLHGIWGLDQLGRLGHPVAAPLLEATRDPEPEIRANAARALGSIRAPEARNRMLDLLEDDSPRVRSLAAIALSRVSKPGDTEAIDSLFETATSNPGGAVDPVLRHACLTGVDRLGTVAAAVQRVDSPDREARLLALLFLRRHQSAELGRFLGDADPLVRREAIRAIYDTTVLDGPAGSLLAELATEAGQFPDALQRRIMAANFRRGGPEHARNLLRMAGDGSLTASVRESALHALRSWAKEIGTDPVLGHFRPLVNRRRSLAGLGVAIGPDLKKFLASEQPPHLTASGLRLADEAGVPLEEATLRTLAGDLRLDPELRVAALDGFLTAAGPASANLVTTLLDDDAPEVAAAALRHGFALGLPGIPDRAKTAIFSGSHPAARAGIDGLPVTEVATLWRDRQASGVRPELWLDLFLALQEAEEPEARQLALAHAASGPQAVHQLSATGGDASSGESVFRNQGACLQCHRIGSEGGVQGPELSRIAERLTPEQLVESLVDPNAVIADGYGSSVVTLRDGTVLMGRIPRESPGGLTVVQLDGTSVDVPRPDIAGVSPPISAMPPLGAALPPRELRDLVAYLASRKGPPGGSSGSAKHGEEKVAK